MNINNSNSSRDLLLKIIYIGYFTLAFCVSSTGFQFRSHFMTLLSILSAFLLFTPKLRFSLKSSIISICAIFYISIISNTYSSTLNISMLIYPIQYTCLAFSLFRFCRTKKYFVDVLKIVYVTGFVGGPIIGAYQMITGSYLFPVIAESYVHNDFISNIISTANQYNANYVALNMLFIFIIGFALHKEEKNKVYGLTNSVLFISILLTYSRTTIIALVIALIGIYIRNKKYGFETRNNLLSRYGKLFLYFIIGFIFIYYNFSAFVGLLNSENTQLIFKLKSGDSNFTSRYDQWIGSLKLISRSNIYNIIFGYGQIYPEKLGQITGHSMTAHNIFFEQLSMHGMIGFFLIIRTIYYSTVNYIRNQNNSPLNVVLSHGAISIILCYQMISIIGLEFILIVIFSEIVNKFGGDINIEKSNSDKKIFGNTRKLGMEV